ncbi:MAG: hypothetical protein WCJ54_03470, partial [Actinomycetota bacterium]
MKKRKKIFIVFSIVLVALISISLIYLSTGTYDSKDLAKANMVSDKNVTVVMDNGINFVPSM